MRHVLQRLARGLFRRLFRVELRGWEHYPRDEPRWLIVANHVSYLDGALLAAFLPDVPIFVINTHMARHWWVKPFIAVTRHISIDPTNSHYLKTLIQHLKAGERVAVFPEGRISVTGALMKIYEGPALAADRADAALVPVYVEGAQYSLLSRLGGMVRRRLLPRIRLTMLPPRRLIATAGNGRARRRQLGRQLDDLMVELAYAGMNIDQPLVSAMLETWERHGGGRAVLEDAQQQRLGWRALFARAFILADLLENSPYSPRPPGEGLKVRAEGPGARVGLLLPNSTAAGRAVAPSDNARENRSGIYGKSQINRMNLKLESRLLEIGQDHNGKLWSRNQGILTDDYGIHPYTRSDGFQPGRWAGTAITGKESPDEVDHKLITTIPDTPENREALRLLIEKFDKLRIALFNIITPEMIVQTLTSTLQGSNLLPRDAGTVYRDRHFSQ